MKDSSRKQKFSGIVQLVGIIFAASLWLPTTVGATTKILLVGDSLSSGYGLQGPGWVELANQAMEQQGLDVEIINDSISGDTTAGGVARIQDSLERVAPDWLIVELGGNDGLRGLPPKEIESNLQKMISAARQKDIPSLLLGIRIPPNYGRAYTTLFEKAFENVAAATGAPLLPFFIGDVGGDPALNQADRIHPNDQAQPLIRDRVLPFIKQQLGL